MLLPGSQSCSCFLLFRCRRSTVDVEVEEELVRLRPDPGSAHLAQLSDVDVCCSSSSDFGKGLVRIFLDKVRSVS